MLQTIISIVQVVLAVFLMVVVLLQQKGSGLGATFGGSSNVYSTKRGIEKVLFHTTIIISILFFATSFVAILL